jgi:hypothetical protein
LSTALVRNSLQASRISSSKVGAIPTGSLSPLDGPLGFSLNVRLHRFADEVEAVSSSFAVRTLRPLEPLRN